MISFKKFSDIASKVSKKLKISKDKALRALVKAQQKGIDPLKWQQNLAMFSTVVSEFDPTIDERSMSSKQKLTQMQHYWNNLDHLASDETKKKNMKMRFGLRNIKLDKKGGKLIDFDEDRDYKDEYKKFQSSDKMRKYRAELNKYNRKRGTYGNGDGKDASHKGNKIVGMEDQSVNRGRSEKSRLVGSKRK
mgnify:CR=1 FL=1